MNELIQLTGTGWAEAWVLTLIHSLWQGALVVALVYLTLWLFSIHQPRLRYLAGLIGLSAFSLMIIATFFIVAPESGQSGLIQEENVTPTITQVISSQLEAATHNSIYLTFIREHLSIILNAWIIGVLLLLLRIAGGYQYMRMVIRRSNDRVPEEWRSRIRAIRSRLNISREIRVLHTRMIDMPVVFGHIRPVLLLPVSLLSGLSNEQLEAVFAHELAHIRRNDYLVNLVQSVLESIFFFNPFLWLISDILRKEREKCCDDLAVEYCADRRSYALALSSLEEYRLAPTFTAMSLAGNKGDLIHRIKRLIEPDYGKVNSSRWVVMILLTVSLFTFSYFTYRPEMIETQMTDASANLVMPISEDVLPTYFPTPRDTVIEEPVPPTEEQPEYEEETEDLMEIPENELWINPDVWVQWSEALDGQNYDYDFDFDFPDEDAWEVATNMNWSFVMPDLDFSTFNFRFDTLPGVPFDSLTDEQKEKVRQAEEKMREVQDQMRELNEEQRTRMHELQEQQQELQRANRDRLRDIQNQQRELQRENRQQLMELHEQQMELNQAKREEMREWIAEHQDEWNQAREKIARAHRDMAQRKYYELSREQQDQVNQALHNADRALRQVHPQLMEVPMNMHLDKFRDEGDFEDRVEKMLHDDGYLDGDQELRKLKITEDSFSYNGKDVKEKDLRKYLHLAERKYGELGDAKIEIKRD